MDTRNQTRKEEIERLSHRIAELTAEEQSAKGMFETTPHFSEIENAGHALGQQVSRAVQERLQRESLVDVGTTACCPTCGLECDLQLKRRTLQGKDGPVEVVEPCGYCRRCRRSFFPSADTTGTR